MLTVSFEKRDFSKYPRVHWETLEVERFTKNAIGGPKYASLIATGSQLELFEFVEMLRCPVYIFHKERGKRVWWGFINKVTIFEEHGIEYGISLDSMSNKLAVAYTENGERFTTTWDSDATSTAEYGTKELLLTAHEITATQVAQFQDTQLENRKYPSPTPPQWGKVRKQAVARIECGGWWDTLGWRYYANDKGKIAYEENDTWGGREIGEDDRPRAAQSFQNKSGSSWVASKIELSVWKVGAPTDNLEVALYSDSGNAPNAQLSGTDDIAGANVETYSNWVTFTLDTPQTLADSTLYWIHIQRSGGIDADNYFMIEGTTTDGYQDGGIKLYKTSTSSWIQPYDRDFNFRVLGDLESTTQITDAFDSHGEFIESYEVEDTSGVNSSPYRDGEATAQYEIEQLLKMGTSNNRRLLATISDLRRVRIYEEPAQWSEDYKIDPWGKITDRYDNPILPEDCPVGNWTRLKGVVPDTINTTRISNPTHFFIEESEYSPKRGYRIMETRDVLNPFDFTIREG